jgi:hypothetical protein
MSFGKRFVLGTVIAALTFGAGCGPKGGATPSDSPTAGPAAKTDAAGPARPKAATTDTMSAPSAAKSEAPVPVTPDPTAGAPGPTGFVWTDKPTMANVPTEPFGGTLLGKAFKPTKVTLELENGQPKRLRFTCTEDVDAAVAGDLIDAIVVFGSAGPPSGVWTKSLESAPGDATAYYRHVVGEDVASAQTAWACALSFDSPLTGLTPGAKVKGKAIVCFADEAKSFLGGEFEAEVR